MSYTLIYWPSIPGRGEFIRLAFEYTKAAYSESSDFKGLVFTTGSAVYPPHFAPPILAFTPDESKSKAAKTGSAQDIKSSPPTPHYISQTSAILGFLGPRLSLVGDVDGDDELSREIRRIQVAQITKTVLDLSNEAHDVHHPVDVSLTKEAQQGEVERRAPFFRNYRVPKFFKYFETVLGSNPSGPGRFVGKSITTADLTFFQVMHGLHFSFPRLLSSLETSGKYDSLFAHFESVGNEPSIKEYMTSDRRRKYSMGLFREYPELDGEFDEQWKE